MGNQDRNQNQGGRQDRQPGQEDEGVGTDPRRTREQAEEGDKQRQNQIPRRDQRVDDTPKAG